MRTLLVDQRVERDRSVRFIFSLYLLQHTWPKEVLKYYRVMQLSEINLLKTRLCNHINWKMLDVSRRIKACCEDCSLESPLL